jgi:hypothetical protein
MPRSPLAALDTSALQRELKRRARRNDAAVRRLQIKRDRLVARLREIEREITRLGGKRRSYPRNETTLAEALAKLLAKTTMSMSKATVEVQKAGYRTSSPNFRNIVNQTLLKDKRFKRVGRGRYTAK